MKLLYLLDGEMQVYDGGRSFELPSARKDRYINTVHELAEQNAWKYEGSGAEFQGRRNPYASAGEIAERSCEITAAIPYDGRVLYALTTPDMGGLYLRSGDPGSMDEGHWRSERNFRIADLHHRGEKLVFSLMCADAQWHIALMNAGNANYRVITQGDTKDTAPYLSRDGRSVYYASSGFARSAEGVLMATGPSALLRLNLANGSLEELFTEENWDYLRPKEGPDGALYFIRRPYQQKVPRGPGLGQKIRNVGAFFKGIGKLISYIGDPEKARKTPQIAGQSGDAGQQRLLEGMFLDIQGKQGASDSEEEGLVPSDWVLMRREANGELQEVQKGVADYDFAGGSLVYTNGRRIIFAGREGKTTLCRGAFIPRVCVMEDEEGC